MSKKTMNGWQGNHKCPVCKSRPKNGVRFTAGKLPLKHHGKVVLAAGVKSVVCQEHLRQMHV